jgi:hypothetical protein
VIVADGSPCDEWLLALSLLQCLRRGPRIDHAGAGYMRERLLVIVRRKFDRFIESFVTGITDVGDRLLDSPEPEGPCSELAARVEAAFRSFCFPGKIEELCRTQFLAAIDGTLVSLVYATPGRCTVGHAIQWNTTITVCDMDKHLALPLWREAAMVVQSAMVLCVEPSMKDEMAPHLPPVVVFKILSAQTPDDFSPVVNETEAFAAHFGIKPEDQGKVDIAYKGDFDGLDEILSHEWDVKRFRTNQIQGFEFLTEFVA